MRKFLSALFILPVISIQTGSTAAKSQVTTQVSGATVETHITTNVNGNITTTESTQPGRIEVVATSAGTEVSQTAARSSVTPSPTFQTPFPQTLVPEITFFQGVKTFFSTALRSMFQKIFSLFPVHS